MTGGKYPAVRISVLFAAFVAVIHFTPARAIIDAADALVLALGSCGFVGAAVWSRARRPLLAAALALVGLLGAAAARYPMSPAEATHVSRFLDLGRQVELIGSVIDDPEDDGAKCRWTLEVDSILLSRHLAVPSAGRVQVRTSYRTDVRYGERIAVRGALRAPRGERNPGEFDFARYLSYRGIYGTVHVREPSFITRYGTFDGLAWFRDVVLPVKHHIMNVAHRTLSPLAASIVIGLLVGERSEIPQEVIDAFSLTGTIHILSLSGLHVVFISVLLMGLFSFVRVPYAARVWLTLGCLALYTMIGDLAPSIVRASIMTGVVLVGTLLQRRRNVINSLFVALLIILFLDPLALFDIGLQLSFAAVLSIVVIYPRLERGVRRFGVLRQGPVTLVDKTVALLLVSVAAQIGTVPFTAYYFYKIPVVALAANVLIVPLSSAVMGLGFFSSVAEAWSPTLAQVYSNVNEYVVRFMVLIAQWAAQLPLAYVEYYRMGVWSMVFFYLLVAYVLLWERTNVRRYGLLAGAVLTAIAVWWHALRPQDGLRVYFLDVGQGDCAFIRFPDERVMIVDAGDRDEQYDSGEQIVAPFLRKQGISRIDWIVISHPHDDHMGGVDYLLRHFEVGAVLDPGQFYRSDIYRDVLEGTRKSGVPYRRMRAGDVLAIDGETALYFLHPTEAFVSDSGDAPRNTNNSSLVVKLQFRTVGVLLLGDAELETWPDLRKYGPFLRCDLVKVAHHGSWNGTPGELVAATQPRYAVISVGRFNKFNHPSPQVVLSFQRAGAEVVRTDEAGAAVFAANGDSIYRVH